MALCNTYIQYVLHNAIVASYTVGSSGDRPTESITLNFTKMDVTYTPFDQQNQPMSNMRASYDVATAKTT